MTATVPPSKTAITAASAGVETVFRTLFGSCTGEDQYQGLSALRENVRNQKNGYIKHNSSSSRGINQITPELSKQDDKRSDGELTDKRKVQFSKYEPEVSRDDIMLTLKRIEDEDDAVSAITALTLEEMERRFEREDGLSAITAPTLDDMAAVYTAAKRNARNSQKSKCQNFEIITERNCLAHSSTSNSRNLPIMKQRNRTNLRQNINSQPFNEFEKENILQGHEMLDESMMRERAAESYETVLARLNYLKRSIESRQSRKRDEARSRSRNKVNQECSVEYGEI